MEAIVGGVGTGVAAKLDSGRVSSRVCISCVVLVLCGVPASKLLFFVCVVVCFGCRDSGWRCLKSTGGVFEF